jgi:hypothetical protein
LVAGILPSIQGLINNDILLMDKTFSFGTVVGETQCAINTAYIKAHNAYNDIGNCVSRVSRHQDCEDFGFYLVANNSFVDPTPERCKKLSVF